MYKMPSFVDDLVVEPNINFYRIPPIHQHLTNDSSIAPKPQVNGKQKEKQSPKATVETSPELAAKQADLIKRLEAFHIKVDKYIQEFGGDKAGKQTKQSGKADKKAGNAEKKSGKPQENTADLPAFMILERRSTASIVYRGLDSTLDPFAYKTNNLPAKFTATLQIHEQDRKWLEVVKKLGQKQGIQIDEKPSGDQTIKVKFVPKGNVELTGQLFSTPVQGRIAVWKSIGVLLGIFDFTDASISAPTHRYLRVAEDFLQGREKLDDVVREACRRLSAHDFLAANDVPSLADFIVQPLIAEQDYLPNNVELWVNRLNF